MKIIHDEKNYLMPYVMNLFPTEKAKILSALYEDEPIEPLS